MSKKRIFWVIAISLVMTMAFGELQRKESARMQTKEKGTEWEKAADKGEDGESALDGLMAKKESKDAYDEEEKDAKEEKLVPIVGKEGEEAGYIAEELIGVEKKTDTQTEDEQRERYTNDANEWDGEVAEGFAEGDGSTDNPYRISTAAELALCAKWVNEGFQGYPYGNYILTDNINLGDNEWTPIGNYLVNGNGFYGTFDGGGHSIVINGYKEEGQYIGLFGFIKGTVKNLNISGNVSLKGEYEEAYIGGLVGWNNGCIHNCSSSLNISNEGSFFGENIWMGGLAGYNKRPDFYGDYTLTSIHNSNFMGNIKIHMSNQEPSSIYVGGLVGQNYYQSFSYSTFMKGCYNAGDVDMDITSTDTTSLCVGGLVGKNMYENISTDVTTIENCYTTGNITGNVTSTKEADTHVGGLVGHSTLDSYYNKLTIKNCYVMGDMEGNAHGDIHSEAYVGGLVGENYCKEDVSSSSAYQPISVINGCLIIGNVNGSSSNDLYIGAVAGKNNSQMDYNYRYEETKVNGRIQLERNVAGIHGDVMDAYGLLTRDTYMDIGWDLDNDDWMWEEDDLYPYLKTAQNEYPFPFYYGVSQSRDCKTLTIRYPAFLSGVSCLLNNTNESQVPDGSWTTMDNGDTIEIMKGDDYFLHISGEKEAGIITKVFGPYRIYWDGEGTIDNPFLINDAMDLEGLSKSVYAGKTYEGMYFKLTDDINLNGRAWIPIGYAEFCPFLGNFDGGGKSIFQLDFGYDGSEYKYLGLFGYNKGKIENITITGDATLSGEYGDVYVGGLAGKNEGSIENCGSTLNITNDGTFRGSEVFVGGLVGCNDNIVNQFAEVSIRNCYNAGDVQLHIIVGNDTIHAYVGGMVGRNYNSNSSGTYGNPSTASIENCYVRGRVEGTIQVNGESNTDAIAYVGGVVGSNHSDSKVSQSESVARIEYCYSTGNVKGDVENEGTLDSVAYVGGIAGYNYNRSYRSTAVNYCYTTGNVEGNAKNEKAPNAASSYVGGLVGSHRSENYGAEVRYNFITGNIKGSSSNHLYIGAAVGEGYNELYNFRYGEVTVNNEIPTDNNASGIDGDRKTAYDFLTRDTFTNYGWRFDNDHWLWEEDDLYPYLAKAGGEQDYPFPFYSGVKLSESGKTLTVTYPNFVEDVVYAVNNSRITIPQDGWKEIASNESVDLPKGENYLHISGTTADGKSITEVHGPYWVYWNGEGTEDNPFELTEAVDLENLSKLVNAGNLYKDVYFIMTDDIDLEEEAWTPIGSYSNYFMGVFKGNGKSITGMNVDGNYDYAGLFGCNRGKIENLSVWGKVRINKYNEAYAGGLVGLNTNGTIENCGALVDIEVSCSSNAYIGGLIGRNDVVNHQSTIKKCYAKGDVAGTSSGTSAMVNTGGLVGYNTAPNTIGNRITIQDCYASGGVEANAGSGTVHAGGLVGYNTNVGTNGVLIINNCYATGDVKGYFQNVSSSIGGLIGYNDTKTNSSSGVTNCLVMGNVLGKQISGSGFNNGYSIMGNHVSGNRANNYRYDGVAIIKNEDITVPSVNNPNTDNHGGKLSANQLLRQETYSTSTYLNWTFDDTNGPWAWEEDDRFPYLKDAGGGQTFPFPFVFLVDKESQTTSVPNLDVTVTYPKKSIQDAKYATYPSEILPEGFDGFCDIPSDGIISMPKGEEYYLHLTGVVGGKKRTACFGTYNVDWKGKGTEESPYLIEDRDDLKKFSDRINAGGANVEGKHFKLTQDIDLNKEPWTPIGCDNGFQSNFDGDGKTIRNLNVEGSYPYAGLFGINTEGTIRNLNVEGEVSSNFSLDALYIGGLLAYNTGTIENCGVTVTVRGESAATDIYAGGLVGCNDSAPNQESSIRNCYAQGEVKGDMTSGGNGNVYVGGLAGCNVAADDSTSTAVVENCYAKVNTSGNVATPGTVNMSIGGLLGYNGRENTFYNAIVKNCYSTGEVEGRNASTDSGVGGLVGLNSGKVENGYSISGVDATDGFVGGLIGHNDGTVNNGYSNRDVYTGNGIGNGSGTVTPLTTAQMLSKDVLDEGGAMEAFGTTDWMKRDTDDTYRYYPELKVFGIHENDTIRTSSKESVQNEKSDKMVVNTTPIDPVVYGRSFSDLTITGEAKNEIGEVIAGTFVWVEEDRRLTVADNNNTFEATFIPEDYENYKEVTVPVEVVVYPKEITITPTEGQSKVYGEEDPDFTYDITNTVDYGNLKVGLEEGDEITGSLERAGGEGVGAYEMNQGSLDVVESDNYNITFTSGVNFTIQKATPQMYVEADPDTSSVYGEEVTISIAVKRNGDGDVPAGRIIVKDGDIDLKEGVLDENGECTLTFSLKVGDYNLTIQYEGGQNYVGVEASFPYHVVKADPHYHVPSGLTAVYGDTLADILLPEGWKWEEEEGTKVGNEGEQVHYAIYTPEDTDNYNIVSGIPVIIQVSALVTPTPTPTEPPITEPPVTEPPVTEPPVTEPPVTEPPITEPPVTEPPVTEPPITEPPITEPPITEPPITEPPVTEPPITEPPITEPPITEPPVTEPPITEPPITEPPITEPPITEPPITEPPITEPPITEPPVTEPPITEPPITEPPVTEPPITEPPITKPPITEPPITKPPITEPPITEPPVTEPPVTEPPITEPPITEPPITEPPITEPSITEPPITEPPITEPPITEPPITEPPVTEPPDTNPTVVPIPSEPSIEPPGPSSTIPNNVIKPKQIKSLLLNSKKKGTVLASWKTNEKVAGYEVVYARNKKMKLEKKVKATKKKRINLKKLKKGKIYYVRVRAYRLNGKNKVYGPYSKIKKIRIKR